MTPSGNTQQQGTGAQGQQQGALGNTNPTPLLTEEANKNWKDVMAFHSAFEIQFSFFIILAIVLILFGKRGI